MTWHDQKNQLVAFLSLKVRSNRMVSMILTSHCGHVVQRAEQSTSREQMTGVFCSIVGSGQNMNICLIRMNIDPRFSEGWDLRERKLASTRYPLSVSAGTSDSQSLGHNARLAGPPFLTVPSSKERSCKSVDQRCGVLGLEGLNLQSLRLNLLSQFADHLPPQLRAA